MILRTTRLGLVVFLLFGAVASCATLSNRGEGYQLVPPSNFAAAVAAAEPYQGLAEAPPETPLQVWTDTWAEGPVSSLLVKEEFDRYAALDTAVERAEFIRLFWARRNPEPEADYNENLQEFQRRVTAASELFANDHEPGWETPFGRTLLVLGFPTIVRAGDAEGPRDETTEAVPAEGGERVFWQYGLRPDDLTGTSLNSVRALGAAATPSGQGFDDGVYFVTFGYVRGGWSLQCRPGWLASSLGDGWGGFYGGGGSGPGAGGVVGASPGVGEAASPDVPGSGGVYTGGGGGGYAFNGPRVIRVGSACRDLFTRARSSWLLNAVNYP